MNTLSYLNQAKSWDTSSDINHVVTDLYQNRDIEVLELTGNTLDKEAAAALIEPLSTQKKLRNLQWNDLFTGRLKTTIGIALKSLSTGLIKAQVNLVEINLSDNAFGPNGVIGVTELLGHSCCYNLKVLNMNNQGLGHQGCRYLVDALKKGRQESEYKGLNLEVFIAGRNRLENAGMKMLLEFFGDGMTSLKKLVLLQNGIGIHGIEGINNIYKMLKLHKNLEILNLSDNTIKSNGAKILIELFENFNLKELYLDDCLLGNKGLRHLLSFFESHCYELNTLTLSGNEIGNKESLNMINIILDYLPRMVKLDIRENNIKKAVMQEIKNIVTECSKDNMIVEDETTESDDDLSSEEFSDESSDATDNECEESENEYDESTNECEESDNDYSIEKQKSLTEMYGIEQNNPKLNESNSKPLNINENKKCDGLFINSSLDFMFNKMEDPKIFINKLSELLKENYFLNINQNSLPKDCVYPITILNEKVVELVQLNPDSAIRTGLLLCKNNSFELGSKLIALVLSSTSNWSQGTNALLVEMNYLKSEDKHFKAISTDKILFKKVLQHLTDNYKLLDSVKINLITVLRNMASDADFSDVLTKLEFSMSSLKL